VIGVAGDEDNDGLGFPPLDGLEDRGSANVREEDVEEGEVELLLPQVLECLPPIPG